MSKRKEKRILIVEDERDLAEALKRKLVDFGYSVTVSSDGCKAVDIMREESFSAAILDLVVPKKDCFCILGELKDSGRLPPAIILTNLYQKDDEMRAASLGAKHFFVKSNVSLDEIVSAVEKIA